MSDHYSVLGIAKKATADEIKKAYRKLALKHHPDKNDSSESADYFKKIVEAYDTLGNDSQRIAYDKSLVSSTRVSSAAPFQKPTAQHPTQHPNHYPYPPPPPHHQQQHSYTSTSSSYFWNGPRAAGSSTSHHSYQTGPPPSQPPPPHSQRPNSGSRYNPYNDDDEFDFTYKRNQTSYDSFANSRNYFNTCSRGNNSPKSFKNNYKNGYKFGSSFKQAGYENKNNSDPDGRYYPNDSTYAEQNISRDNPESFQVPHPQPPPNATQSPPSNNEPNTRDSTFYYSHGTTSVPSVPADPLPKSWQRQQTNFKKPPPTPSATTIPTPPSKQQSTSTQYQNICGSRLSQSPPSSINVKNSTASSNMPPDVKVTERPKTPPANNRRPKTPSASDSNPSVAPASRFKFDASGFIQANRSTPQNIRTNKRSVNKSGRPGIPLYHSRSPSFQNSNLSTDSNGNGTYTSLSGRPSRTSQEEINDAQNNAEYVSTTPVSEEEPDDEIEVISESDFFSTKRRAPAPIPVPPCAGNTGSTSNAYKKAKSNAYIDLSSVPNDGSVFDFAALRTAAPMNQTLENFNLEPLQRSLVETHNDDISHGKKLKKHKKDRSYELLESKQLSVADAFDRISIPETPDTVPNNMLEYKRYKEEFQIFQSSAFKLRSKLIDYIKNRDDSDTKHMGSIFKRDENMDLYESALNNDIYIQHKLIELDQAVLKVMNCYREIKQNFR